MPDVNVSAGLINEQIAVLRQACEELETARKSITSRYRQLSAQWNDAKYRTLGEIVDECASSLRNIASTYLRSQKKLLALLAAINAYENTHITKDGVSGAEGGGYTMRLTAREVSARWRTGVESIDEQIANYKESLMARGVPEGKWLRDTLARHRAAMLEQEGRDLEAAGGHASDADAQDAAYLYPADYPAFYDQLADAFRRHCLHQTNPRYRTAPEWQSNCQRCVPAYERLRRGGPVTARPSTHGSAHLSLHPFDAWRDADVQSGQGSGMESIQNAMTAWGEGARAQVVVYWAGPLGGGHTFIAEQRQGETVFIDPQTGSDDCSGYFQRVAPGRTQFCRIDNLMFSTCAEECFEEV